MNIDDLRQTMREVDRFACVPPEYPDLVLISQVKDEKRWLVTAEHGKPGEPGRKVNRYVIQEEVTITPVSDFG